MKNLKENITVGENFDYCEPIVLGAPGFSFTQDDNGKYTRKSTTKPIQIGNNVFMNAFVIVEYGLMESTIIGDNCIIDGHVMIGHDVKLGKSVQIGTGSKLLGHVKVGNFTKIFPGVIINPKVSIGKNCIIGIGSYVRHDIPDNSVVYGNPAKVIKEKINYPHRKYE